MQYWNDRAVAKEDASGRKYVLCTDLRRYQPDPWYRAFTDHNDGIEQCDPVLCLSPKLPDICHHAADTGGSRCDDALSGISEDEKRKYRRAAEEYRVKFLFVEVERI